MACIFSLTNFCQYFIVETKHIRTFLPNVVKNIQF